VLLVQVAAGGSFIITVQASLATGIGKLKIQRNPKFLR
jgi:hypothetical protein